MNMPIRPMRHPDVSIDEKVAFLRSADAYRAGAARVEVIETHMSWVFLTSRLAYKLKKPVQYEFLDFSTLESRHKTCEREVRLNRRLARDVYLGILPLIMLKNRHLRLGGRGTIVDWLVKMRRLPAHRMLDAAIRDKTVDSKDIARLGELLAGFYRRSAPLAMSATEYLQRFENDIHANRLELGRPNFELPLPQVDHLTRTQLAFLKKNGEMVARRARGGKIIDAHGDLRPEHICLTPHPVIIDCLEFNRGFRLLDPVDELSYLAMECERLGAAAIGEPILHHYFEATGDAVPNELTWFYRAFRACLRAKIAIWHIADHEVRDIDKWRRRASDYLDLAERYVSHW